MASIVAQLGITESTPARVLQAIRRMAQDLTIDIGTVTAYADERREVRQQIAQAWEWYEAHENNGHLEPHELAYADLNSDWMADGEAEGEDNE